MAGEDDKEWMSCSIDRPSATSLGLALAYRFVSWVYHSGPVLLHSAADLKRSREIPRNGRMCPLLVPVARWQIRPSALGQELARYEPVWLGRRRASPWLAKGRSSCDRRKQQPDEITVPGGQHHLPP